ncbi:MAG: chromosomal replication initiator protein DnaA [Anaerolineaceae bacterium]|jgi:chromosomal replication initiator protein|nr:chromosomal replication initiator protein DnaA [Anaerolineaceae bacterium]
MNAQQAWQATIGQLQMELSKASFDTWVKNTQLISFEDESGTFALGAGNAYACDWLDSRLKSTVVNKLSGMMARPVAVEFKVWSAPQVEMAEETVTAARKPQPVEKDSYDTHLNARYRFDNFVVGSANRLAHAACQAVAENPARAYNPLFIYSGVGLGKTHMLHAIGNAVLQQGKQVLYVSSEEFTNDLVYAIRTKTTAAFREKYRQVDVLLIDDIQFIAGKDSTQEEFFHTFNALYGQDKQIVMTSDRSPKAMSTLEERLRSRFEWGLTVDMQAPDYETRLAILHSKAEKLDVQVPEAVIERIAALIQTNVRELEGAWNRVLAFSQLSGQDLTLSLTERALSDFLPQPSSITPEYVLETVSEFFNISINSLTGRSRARDIAFPRQVAMYLLRELGGVSLPRIGEELGGRDHTTVMYACDKVAELIESDDRTRKQILQLKGQLQSHALSV